MDCSLPGFSVHGIFQARVLEWVPFFILYIYIYIWNTSSLWILLLSLRLLPHLSNFKNIGVQVVFQNSVYIFLIYIPRSGISESYGIFIFSFLRKLHIVFHGNCTNLHPHQQCKGFSFPHILARGLSGNSHSERCEVVHHVLWIPYLI